MTWYTSDLDVIHRPAASANTPHPGWWHAMADNFTAIGTWVEDTGITWDGSSSTPTVGNGTVRSDYIWLDGILVLDFATVWGSTTVETATGNWTWSLPAGVEFAEVGATVGIGQTWYGSGSNTFGCVIKSKTATTFELFPVDGDNVTSTPLGTNLTNFAVDFPNGTGDKIMGKIVCPVKPFDPLGAAAWHSARWVYGPRFQALAVAHGGDVTSWPDEIGTFDWSTGTPTLLDYLSTANNRAVLDFGSGDTLGDDYSSNAPSYAAGVTEVVVFEIEAVAVGTIVGATGGATNTFEIADVASTDTFIAWDGAQVNGPAATTGMHLAFIFYPGSAGGANVVLDVDGSQSSVAKSGGESTTSSRVGALDGLRVHFEAKYEGNLIDSTVHDKFKAWVRGLGATIS